MDLSTIGGLLLTVIVVVVVLILDGGTPAELFTHPSAILLTLVGSTLATAVTVPLSVTLSLPKAFLKTILHRQAPIAETVEQITTMADKARREGLLSLEEDAKTITDKFLKKGIMLVVDGVESEAVRSILELEIHQMEKRHEPIYGFFNVAGGFSPTFGIIGTVMGLISVLKSLSDPDALAASIAAAFLATLWGLISANMIFMPIGGKLAYRSHEEASYRHMMLEGILALQAGENPRLIYDKLVSFIPPKARQKDEAEAEA
ncbi:MAG: MotA/TolQ/ExbB proton channel family protein [Anaerolineaceae bacterium]|nr:MotA/TolQ/ExbB proton channel family protein [Anaerolineaceae bacterium]